MVKRGGAISIFSPRVFSPASKDRLKTRLHEDASNFCALVTLDLNSAFFDRAACAAGFLHLLGQHFLFWQPDADKVGDHGYGLAAAARRLTQDVHTTTAFSIRRTLCVLFREAF